MRKRIAIAAAVVAIGVAAGGAAVATNRTQTDPEHERNAEARYTEAHRGDAAVTQADAERAAAARHPGTVTDTHLESESGSLRWEVKPDDGTTVWEVQVDAQTGRVVSDHPDE